MSMKVAFPPEAKLAAIAEAMAIAAGASYYIKESGNTKYVVVRSLRVQGLPNCPEVAVIDFLDGNGTARHASYHFEFGDGGERGILPPNNDFWQEVMLAVVRQFGGKVFLDENDASPELDEPSHWPADWESTGFEALQALIVGVPRVSAEVLNKR